MISTSAHSGRPKHEQELIDREIRKNSGMPTGSTAKLTSPKAVYGGGHNLPIHSRQPTKVFMVSEIIQVTQIPSFAPPMEK